MLVSRCVDGARAPPPSAELTCRPKQPKMVYASSKDALKRSLAGIATELQANDPEDIEYDSIIKVVSKGLAG